MAPKRMRQDAEKVSSVKTSAKQRISQFLNVVPALRSTFEAFSTSEDLIRYSDYFHGREIAFDRRFSVQCLSATRL